MTRSSSGDQVADHVRSLIWDGRLRAGDHLRQDDLATELGVSRIPVREALVALEREGWVTLELHRGAFIRGLDEDAVADHYAFLGSLYGLIAHRAVERADDAAIAGLEDAARAAAEALSVDDFRWRNDRFLRDLFTAANSPRLLSVSRLLSGVVPGNYFAMIPAGREIQQEAHAAVVAALRNRDGAEAAAAFDHAMQCHATAVAEVLLAHRTAIGTADDTADAPTE